MLQAMNGLLESGVFPADDLQALHDKIPKAVHELYPDLVRPGNLQPQFSTDCALFIARDFCGDVLYIAEEAEKIFSLQAGVATGTKK
eukprot:10995121-Heterocapsa_arctica.AAC.2